MRVIAAALAAAATLDMQLDLRDASNCGTDNLCLYGNEWPHDMRNGALTKEEIMTGSTTDAERPYIELVGAEENGAFYLASPCVADFSVTMGTCQCKEYYPSDKIYTEAVIEEWGYGYSPVNMGAAVFSLGASTSTHEIFPYKLLGIHRVQLEFPGQVYLGDTVEFDYVPEGETKPVTRTYVYGESYDDPVEFDAALKALTNIQKDETEETTNRNIRLKEWFKLMNPSTRLGDFVDGVQESSYAYQGMTYHNYEQGTKYKKCVKGYMTDTLNLGEEIPCVKIEGTGYPYEDSNYCYEKSWDKASKMEAGLAVGEVVGGAVAGLVCTSVAPGVGTYAGYCAGNLLVSTAGAYLLSGVQSDDKWPNGLNQ